MTSASAQSVALLIEGETGNQSPVDRPGIHFGKLRSGFGNAKDAGCEVVPRILDPVHPKPARDRVDPGQRHSLARPVRDREERSRLDFLGEGRGVKQHRTRGRPAGQISERRDNRGFLSASVGNLQRGDRIPKEAPPLTLGPEASRGDVRPRNIHRDHRPIVRKTRTPPRRARQAAGEINLRRNAVEVLLRTRSSSGNLRPSRRKIPRGTISVPYGFNVGSPKGPPLVEHGRGLPGQAGQRQSIRVGRPDQGVLSEGSPPGPGDGPAVPRRRGSPSRRRRI